MTRAPHTHRGANEHGVYPQYRSPATATATAAYPAFKPAMADHTADSTADLFDYDCLANAYRWKRYRNSGEKARDPFRLRNVSLWEEGVLANLGTPSKNAEEKRRAMFEEWLSIAADSKVLATVLARCFPPPGNQLEDSDMFKKKIVDFADYNQCIHVVVTGTHLLPHHLRDDPSHNLSNIVRGVALLDSTSRSGRNRRSPVATACRTRSLDCGACSSHSRRVNRRTCAASTAASSAASTSSTRGG